MLACHERGVIWVRLKTKMAACEDLTCVSEVSFDVVAVLPAGGCGARMNMDHPKQVSGPGNSCVHPFNKLTTTTKHIFQLCSHSIHTESMNASHSINLFTNSCHHNYFHQWQNSFTTLKNRQQPTILLFALPNLSW